jgi:MFS family permease
MPKTLSLGQSAVVVGLCLLFTTISINVEAPLYVTYAQLAGLGRAESAFAFAIHPIALLLLLTFIGGISERLGQKNAIIVGMGCAVIATSLMIVLPSLYTLYFTRVVQAFALCLNLGACTAYLVQVYSERAENASMWVGMMTSLGYGVGALLTSIFISITPSITPPSYFIVALGSGLCLFLATRILPLSEPNPEAPLIRLPHFPPLVRELGITLGVAWAVTGLLIAIVPNQLTLVGVGAWSGVALFVVNAIGAVIQPIARRFNPITALKIGIVVLPFGYFIMVLGTWIGFVPMLLLGAALVGSSCYGFIYYGALTQLNLKIDSESRVGATTGLFLLANSGFALPSIGIGYLSETFLGVTQSLLCFGLLMVGIVIVLGVRLWNSEIEVE